MSGTFQRLLCLLAFMWVLVTSALWPASSGKACGFFDDGSTAFVFDHPDYPVDVYARGEMGVVRPYTYRTFMVVAWRHLSGLGLSAEGQKAAVAVWANQLGWVHDSSSDAARSWLDSRKKVEGALDLTELQTYQRDEEMWVEWLNCPADAFLTATSILEARIKQFTPASAEVKEWLAGQDMVFQNCGGTEAVIPQAISASMPALLQADRAYQTAAAYFYSGQMVEARERFQKIAGDKKSPYKDLAGYLIARTWIREATLASSEAPNPEKLAFARAELVKVLANKQLNKLHNAAEGLIGFIDYRTLDAEDLLQALSSRLKEKEVNGTFRHSLYDYALKLAERVDAELYSTESGQANQMIPLLHLRQEDEMTDWILTFEATREQGMEHALERYEEKRSAPWLLAALRLTPSTNPKWKELAAEATKLDKSQPGYLSFVYYRLQGEIASGHLEAARQELDSLFRLNHSEMVGSARNLFYELRTACATDLPDFLTYAPRSFMSLEGQNVSSDWPMPSYSKPTPPEVRFDDDGRGALNYGMPLSLLKEAALTERLPERLRRFLAVQVFTRALLLGDVVTAKEMMPMLKAAFLGLVPFLEAWEAETTEEGQKNATLYLMLKAPGLQPMFNERFTPMIKIDDFRDNWWCALSRPEGASPAAFLNARQGQALEREWATLRTIGAAPIYLTKAAIAFATANPQDPRAPEALHLAVRTTRYGCTDEETSRYSKQAYQLLHKMWPKSEWAAKTKYYY